MPLCGGDVPSGKGGTNAGGAGAGQGEIWDQVNPMGRSPVLGLVAQGTGSHARCVPAQQGPPKSRVPPHLAEHRLRLGQVEAAR